MRIIISPAKKMNQDPDTLAAAGLPVFLEDTEEIKGWLQERSYEELKKLWACSDAIAAQNVDRLKNMDLRSCLTPAILAYEGIQYQYMAPAVFEEDQYTYLQDHLRILSGFYGVLRPFDGVVPYRLEMQARTRIQGKNLYEFWADRLYDQVMDESRVIINLASKEYSRAISAHLQKGDRMITCNFCEIDEKKGKLVQKGVYVKMARGEMVRYMAQTQMEKPEDMKTFTGLDYHFEQELSKEDTYVFVRQPAAKETGA